MIIVYKVILCIVFMILLVAGTTRAKLDPDDILNGHVYLFENGKAEDCVSNLTGNIVGDPSEAKGQYGTALQFDGVSDGIHVPDSNKINTGGPFTNRTIIAVFNCADVSKGTAQTIFEEGGRTRGLVIYVFDGELYAGAWNRAEYNWNGEWISAPIKSDRWYEVAVIIRNAAGKVEEDKFEMWLDGKLVEKRPGGQLHGHSNDNSIGYTKENAVFHDEGGNGNGFYFEGMIDEVWILNQAVDQADLRGFNLSVEPTGKLTETWGAIKNQL